jgi:hypothetical protein
MSILTPSLGILEFDEIPIECSNCDYTGKRTDFSDETKRAIIKTTLHLQLDNERKMLQRIRLLFNRHLNSRHPKILSFTTNQHNLTPISDPEFEADLLENPELAEYLRNHYFNLDTREEYTASRVLELLPFTHRLDLCCQCCGAYLVVPHSFYSMVGIYLDKTASHG